MHLGLYIIIARTLRQLFVQTFQDISVFLVFLEEMRPVCQHVYKAEAIVFL